MILNRIFKTTFAVSRWALCMGACLLLVLSCDVDESMRTSPAEEDVYISLRINVPGNKEAGTRALLPDDESAITNLQVLVFNALDVFQYKAEVGGLDGTIYVRLRKSSHDEPYYLVLLANTSDFTPSGTMTKEEILQQYTFVAMHGGDAGYPNASGTSLPMWGKSTPEIINSATDFGAISVYRAVARVDVGVKFKKNNADNTASDDDQPEAEGLDEFKLTSVRLYNSLDKGYVAPVGGYGTISIPDDAAPYTPNYVEYPVANEKQTDHEIYLAEVKNHTADKSNKAMQERCCIVVGGNYKGSETYYRIDFLEDGKTNATLMDIMRNSRYIFNITSVYGPGYDTPGEAFENKPFNISVNVEHWDHALGSTDYNGQDNFQCSTKDVSLGYFLGSSQKVAVKSNVAVADWVFENESEWQDVFSVELPENATDIGYITFTAKGYGPASRSVRIKINNLSVTFRVTQSNGVYLSPDGVLVYDWRQANNGNETEIPVHPGVNTRPDDEGVTVIDRGDDRDDIIDNQSVEL